MRLAPLLALPPIALGIATAAWMIASAPGPAQVGGDAPALPVRVMTVAAQDIRPAATAWGNLRAAETWVAVAEVQGEVIWRHPDLEPGRLIPAGTEVLRIDPADYELALAQSQADLAVQEAERVQLTAEADNTRRILSLERNRLALAETDLERMRTGARPIKAIICGAGKAGSAEAMEPDDCSDAHPLFRATTSCDVTRTADQIADALHTMTAVSRVRTH